VSSSRRRACGSGSNPGPDVISTHNKEEESEYCVLGWDAMQFDRCSPTYSEESIASIFRVEK
jgi:hypothetical protein